MMLNTFRAYDPSTIHAKSYSTACEACYSRKVKCELLEDGTSCKQCANHGVECKGRTRKRKAHSLDEGHHRNKEHAYGLENLKTSRRTQDSSNESNTDSKRRASQASSTKTAQSIQRSNSISIPELFVSRDSGNGSIPSTSPRADPPLQDKFRNKSFISRSAILGNDFEDIDHAQEERAADEDKISPVEFSVLKLHRAFEVPDLPMQQSLIEAYIERCWTWMPVVDLRTLSGPLQSGDHSVLLLQAIILVGALMRPDVCGKDFIDQQYQRVKALIHSGFERDPLNILAACCLVQWYTPTAPKDISTDVPRFWNTYAVGLAQQLGLQRETKKSVENAGLRKRIWATMRARDNITSSAHGRPRIIQPEDCIGSEVTIDDFEEQSDFRADIFIHYIPAAQILGDLCQLMTRNGEINSGDRQRTTSRLHDYLRALPENFRLYSPSGLAHQYNFELAQLHIPILMAVAILFRPRTVFHLTAANAASATAAFLAFRVFQAIELREHTRFLSSAFAWHLLVTSIPLLSCTKVAALQAEANEALNALEGVLETLGKVRPAAAQNVQNVRAIRKAMGYATPGINSTTNGANDAIVNDGDSLNLGHQILQAYGSEAILQYEQIAGILGNHCNTQAERTAHAAAHTLSCLSGRQDATSLDNGQPYTGALTYLPSSDMPEDIQNAFTAVFEDDTLTGSWMMRDWMDELQL